MADYTRWYRVGSVALTKNSKVVNGTGTYWLSAGLHAGDMFSVDSVTEYEIDTINSNTQLILKTVYAGDSNNESAYRIVRNFTASMAAQVAAHATDLLNDFRRYVDNDMRSIHGKSAYQIACEKGFVGTESQWLESLKGESAYDIAVSNGYTGTESQWLESLIGAGEWASASERIDDIDSKIELIAESTIQPYTRNCIFRGKNLGPFTAEHLASIRNGTYTDMWLGDYFTFPSSALAYAKNQKFRIAAINYLYQKMIVILVDNVLVETTPKAETFTGDWPELGKAPAWLQGTHAMFRQVGALGEDDPGTCGFYPESNWYEYVRPAFIEQMGELFLSTDNLGDFTIPVAATAENTTNPANTIITSWVNLTSKAHLPTMSMIYGLDAFQSAYPYTRNAPGVHRHPQFPLFQVTQQFMTPNAALADLNRVNQEKWLVYHGMNPLDDNLWYHASHKLRPFFVVR